MAAPKWLGPALDYVAHWLEFQIRHTEMPGCSIAVAREGKPVFERAFGHADAIRKVKLTPRHRFRVASHSKTFTATAVMRLREQGRLRLDDPAGQYVKGLHRTIAKATIGQLLSHGAGVIRDGTDGGQWQDRRPFLDEGELRLSLAQPPVLEASSRFKYSNHGYGLLGLVIESVTGEAYAKWMAREVLAPAGLEETTPDAPEPRGAPMARGHSARLPLGRRVVVRGDNRTNAMMPATGFVSTARDLAQFFAQLDPAARKSVLSAASRREMLRQHWGDTHSVMSRHYGFGMMGGRTSAWDWCGHSGAFQGFISRTVLVPAEQLTVSVVTNSVDGPAAPWSDGVLQILQVFARQGAPSARTRGWAGRWWTLWGAVDLVPAGDRVMVAAPAMMNPFLDASELEVIGRDRARIRLAGGYAAHGEAARLVRSGSGKVAEFWLGGTKLLPERAVAAELETRYGRRPRQG